MSSMDLATKTINIILKTAMSSCVATVINVIFQAQSTAHPKTLTVMDAMRQSTKTPSGTKKVNDQSYP